MLLPDLLWCKVVEFDLIGYWPDGKRRMSGLIEFLALPEM